MQLTKQVSFYSRGQEIFNAVSHIAGTALAIAALVLGTIWAVKSGSALSVVGMAVYGATLIILYSMSSLYHFFPDGKAKCFFRIMDHCTIFVLIAGTYTPVCFTALGGSALGWSIFGVEWGLAALGITFNAINMNLKPIKVLSQIAYVIMGWMVVFLLKPFVASVGTVNFLILLAGGIFYSVGIVFYALGKKKPIMHCVWHMFVLIGSALQFLSIMLMF